MFEQISSSHYIEKALIGAFVCVFERTTLSHNIFVRTTFEIKIKKAQM
jgi:hypothetical protein